MFSRKQRNTVLNHNELNSPGRGVTGADTVSGACLARCRAFWARVCEARNRSEVSRSAGWEETLNRREVFRSTGRLGGGPSLGGIGAIRRGFRKGFECKCADAAEVASPWRPGRLRGGGTPGATAGKIRRLLRGGETRVRVAGIRGALSLPARLKGIPPRGLGSETGECRLLLSKDIEPWDSQAVLLGAALEASEAGRVAEEKLTLGQAGWGAGGEPREAGVDT
eukprot:RCo046670